MKWIKSTYCFPKDKVYEFFGEAIKGNVDLHFMTSFIDKENEITYIASPTTLDNYSADILDKFKEGYIWRLESD